MSLPIMTINDTSDSSLEEYNSELSSPHIKEEV